MTSGVRAGTRWLAAGTILGIASWVAYAGIAWIRYGQAKRRITSDETDPLLDQFMPTYEVADRHSARVAAPAEITFAAATAIDLQQSTVIRAIFKSRELILGSEPEKPVLARTLLAWAKALGWGELARLSHFERIFGSVKLYLVCLQHEYPKKA